MGVDASMAAGQESKAESGLRTRRTPHVPRIDRVLGHETSLDLRKLKSRRVSVPTTLERATNQKRKENWRFLNTWRVSAAEPANGANESWKGSHEILKMTKNKNATFGIPGKQSPDL